MNPLLEWLAHFPARQAVPVFVLVGGTLVAVFAVAFVRGGVWALRGRPALRAPACRRCGGLQHGEGPEVPDLCTECGAALHAPHAVRWLRFRKQTLTVLITAPVVLVGGILLSLVLVISMLAPIERRFTALRGVHVSDVDFRAQSAAHQAQPSVVSLVQTIRAGGSAGTEALLELVAQLDAAGSPDQAISSDDVDRVLTLLEELSAGDAPTEPFAAADMRVLSSGHRLFGWRGACMHALATMNLTSDALRERSLAIRRRLLPEPGIALPARVQPIDRFTVRGFLPGEPTGATVRILRVTINGETALEVLPPVAHDVRGHHVNAPAALGEYVVEVHWSVVTDSDAGGTQPGATLDSHSLVSTGSTKSRLIVANGPELLLPMARDAGSLLDVCEPNLSVQSLGDIDQVLVFVQTRGSLALDGSWDILCNGAWQRIGEQRADEGVVISMAALVDHHAGPETATRRLRFMPSVALKRATLAAPIALRGSPVDIARSMRGVLHETIEFDCVLHPRGENESEARDYRAPRDWWRGPVPPTAP
ncbi:MAG: hypothetical protein SGJ11_00680 [Phycisphaerae bacterium]|nr:hypothetical protein [Phycisphaerae bacterium]